MSSSIIDFSKSQFDPLKYFVFDEIPDVAEAIRVGPGDFRYVDNWATPTVLSMWSKILRQEAGDWIPLRDNMYFYGWSYYAAMNDFQAPRYHAISQDENKKVDRVLGLRTLLASAATLIDVWRPGMPIQPRTFLEGPYWVDCGVHINTKEWTAGGWFHNDTDSTHDPSILFDPETRMFSAVLDIEAPAKDGGLFVLPGKKYRIHGKDFENIHRLREIDNPDVELIPFNPGRLKFYDAFMLHKVQSIEVNDEHPFRIAAVMHFLYKKHPYEHISYWW